VGKHQKVTILDLGDGAELGREEILSKRPKKAIDAEVES
jgi:hypothetical protein